MAFENSALRSVECLQQNGKLEYEMSMRLKVLFHDNCFDGAASAAVFTRFYKECVNAHAEVSYQGLAHKAGGAGIDATLFSGDENAIVDFRYSQSPKLTWWFDHHLSAFQQEGDEAHFRADVSGKKFLDATRKSCTKYLAEVCREKFGFDFSPMQELIDWAELIDGASFASPRQAVELAEPALKLMTVLEANQDPEFIPKLISDLTRMSLSQVTAQGYVQAPFAPLWEKHQQAIDVVRQKARMDNGVVHFDVSDVGYDSLNKFIAYYLYPDARYSLWLGRSAKRVKISIGSNAWKPHLRQHDLSKIAGSYGGGGHAVVAAISFKPDELPKAQNAYSEILKQLQQVS